MSQSSEKYERNWKIGCGVLIILIVLAVVLELIREVNDHYGNVITWPHPGW